MAGFVIRRAAAADFDALQQIYRRAALSNPGDRAGLLAHPEFLRLDDDLVGRGRTWVATTTDDDTVVGFAATSRVNDDVLELDDLFVDPDWRRRGAARQLIERIMKEAVAERATSIEVTGNTHAMSFYRAVGFTSETRVATPLGTGTRMRKQIT